MPCVWQEFCLLESALGFPVWWISPQQPREIPMTKHEDVLEAAVWGGSLFLFPPAFWAFLWELASVFSAALRARDAFLYLLWLEIIRLVSRMYPGHPCSKRNSAKNCTAAMIRLHVPWWKLCYPSLLSPGWSTCGSLGSALLPKFQLNFKLFLVFFT